MFESIKNTLGAAKDRAVQASARAFINGKVERFGTVTRLDIDSRQKKISLEILLKGETTPIRVDIDSYEVTKSAEGTWLTIRSARASREWTDAVLKEFVIGAPQKVPDSVKFAL